MRIEGETSIETRPPAPGLRRALPLAALLAGGALALWLDGDHLGFGALARHHAALTAWAEAHRALASAAFFGAYALIVAFSVPGAVWLTLLGGLLFGVPLATALVVLAATLGATALFLAARSALGAGLRARAGGWRARLEAGFRRGEVSFLLILRLVPAVPFFVANLVPAVLGARLDRFVWTTLVGIVPGTLVYVSLGAGLGEQVARGEAPDLGVIFEPQILLPLLGLAALSALPLLLGRPGARP